MMINATLSRLIMRPGRSLIAPLALLGLSLAGVRPALADPTLDEIVKTGYTGHTALDSGATFLGSFNVFFEVTGPTATAKAAYAGDQYHTSYGWYDPKQGTPTLNQLGLDQNLNSTVNFTPSNPFGVYLKDDTSGRTWYSQVSRNADYTPANPQIINHSGSPANGDFVGTHMLIYQASATIDPSGHTYYVGYEDLFETGPNSGSDFDYNDLVVQYTGVNVIPGNNLPIPEPAFYQMGVFLAGGGLMALRLRRKNRK